MHLQNNSYSQFVDSYYYFLFNFIYRHAILNWMLWR